MRGRHWKSWRFLDGLRKRRSSTSKESIPLEEGRVRAAASECRGEGLSACSGAAHGGGRCAAVAAAAAACVWVAAVAAAASCVGRLEQVRRELQPLDPALVALEQIRSRNARALRLATQR
eukprot:6175292-Pleurochrysis_carterae.AAC.1